MMISAETDRRYLFAKSASRRVSLNNLMILVSCTRKVLGVSIAHVLSEKVNLGFPQLIKYQQRQVNLFG